MMPPNILLILADQLRPFELGCYGHPVVETPHIDRLASLGTRFEVACTPNPVCTPARSALISGQYGRSCIGMLGCCGEPNDRRNKFPDTTLPELLNVGDPGYETFLCGSWHLDPNPLRLGFERAFYPNVLHRNSGQTYHDGTGRSWVVEGFAPRAEVAASCDFLHTSRERPFFLYHNCALPHMPYADVPEDYQARYAPAQAVLRPNVFRDGHPYHDNEVFNIYWGDWMYYSHPNEHIVPPLPPGYDLKALSAHYYGMVRAVDEQVGTLLACLEATGQLENTIIVLSANHGDNLGSHWLWNKISVNEEAIRIPLLVAWPGVLPPQVVTSQVASLVDVAPTLLALAGRPLPAHLQGRDLSPILRRQAECLDDGAAVIENLFGEIAIRTPHHLFAMMTRTRADSPRREITEPESLFYDLRSDPYQFNNLAGSSEQREVAVQLGQRLRQWDHNTPWMPTSRGGLYAQGPQHDPQPPRPAGTFGG